MRSCHAKCIWVCSSERPEWFKKSPTTGLVRGWSDVSILNHLINYADYHFAAEEKEMLKHDYPDYMKHRYKYQKMMDNTKALNRKLQSRKKRIYPTTYQLYMSHWPNKHIVGTDKGYSSFYEQCRSGLGKL